MKILWIEDFGGITKPSNIASNMFKELLAGSEKEGLRIFANEYNPDKDISEELPRLFEKNTFHKAYVCKTYGEWVKTTEEQKGDFDVIFIDINLEQGSRKKDRPEAFKDNDDFEKKAGFYIYHLLLKNSFPDDNIAFLTGEIPSLDDFINNCKNLLIEEPSNIFEKSDEEYKKLRKWLSEKANDPYLTLRRGIIEGCRFLKNELQKEKDLENYILFNKTTDAELDKDYICDYLTKLEEFFPLNPPKTHKVVFTHFLKELSAEWEMSWGYFKSEKPVNFWSETGNIEFNFKNFCQNQMKMLRNWTSHNQLSDNLTEKELAFFFMIAMRALFNLRINDIYDYDYDNVLSEVFDKNDSFKINTDIKIKLAQSYHKLRDKMGDFNPTRNEFSELMKDLGKHKDRSSIKDSSIKLFYQNFWHGLFPAQLKLIGDPKGKGSVLMFIDFDYKPIPKSSFPYFLGLLIFNESF